jgi:hypothetical protein
MQVCVYTRALLPLESVHYSHPVHPFSLGQAYWMLINIYNQLNGRGHSHAGCDDPAHGAIRSPTIAF